MSEWKPIDEAPKDVLVMLFGGGTTAFGHQLTNHVWYEYRSGVAMLFHPVLGFEPTHWMPLPQPPKETE
jgi:hypothetical protein